MSAANPIDASLAAASDAQSDAALEFKSFLADVTELIHATTSATGPELAQARARLDSRLASARQSAESLGAAVADQARESAGLADEWVTENPWSAVGIGAALGVFIGILLARRR